MLFNQSTKKLSISNLVITLLTISKTVYELATTFNPESADFENQTCKHNKCIIFNLELVQYSWQILPWEVTPSCCTYRAHNMTLYSQVTLWNSPYKMAEATTTPPQIVEEDYQGPPEIDEVEVRFSEDCLPDLHVTETPDTSTVQLMQSIPQPAAQKMEIAKKK